MSQALIEMAKQIARLQAENEKLKGKIRSSEKAPIKKEPKAQTEERERQERARRWAAQQYERQFNAAMEKIKDRIDAIRVYDPTFMPINNCMDSYGKNKNGQHANDEQ